MAIKLEDLTRAVAAGAAAIRAVNRLESAGGAGDKVFPPTYMKEGRSETKYAMEKRHVEGRETWTVLLDSVASQANRMEEALLEGWRRKELLFPVVWVNFAKEDGLEDLEQISALQAPHRIADALLRDSTLSGTPFRATTVGKEFTDARVNHATGMYKHCPTALVFGVWDSTGPKGGLGAKFQRCLGVRDRWLRRGDRGEDGGEPDRPGWHREEGRRGLRAQGPGARVGPGPGRGKARCEGQAHRVQSQGH